MGSKLDYDQRLVSSNHRSSSILDGNGVKAMTGSILALNLGLNVRLKKQMAKKIKKVMLVLNFFSSELTWFRKSNSLD